jgi:acyl dehydratase
VSDELPGPVISPTRCLRPDDGDVLVARGGYTHPLFSDPVYLRSSPFAARPWPGEAVLLVMGGLAEQTGLYDGWAIALTGFDGVTFRAPAFDDDEILVEIETLEVIAGRSRDVGLFRWHCRRIDGTSLVEALPRFVLDKAGPGVIRG